MTRTRVTGLLVVAAVFLASIGLAQTPTNGSKLVSLDFKDADVINVLRLLAAEGGRNIVVGDDVKGKVSVSLRNVTWDQALDTILEARGLQKIEKAGVIRIVSSEQLAKEREAQAKADEAKRKAEIEVRTKMAEAQVKEQEVQQRQAGRGGGGSRGHGPRPPQGGNHSTRPTRTPVRSGTRCRACSVSGVQPILPCRILQGGQATGVTGRWQQQPDERTDRGATVLATLRTAAAARGRSSRRPYRRRSWPTV